MALEQVQTATPKLDVTAGANHAAGVLTVGPTAETKEAEALAIFVDGVHATEEPTYGAMGKGFTQAKGTVTATQSLTGLP